MLYDILACYYITHFQHIFHYIRCIISRLRCECVPQLSEGEDLDLVVQETTGTAQSGGQPAAHHFSGKEVQDTTGLHLLEILYPLMYFFFNYNN